MEQNLQLRVSIGYCKQISPDKQNISISFGASYHCEYRHLNSILQGERGQKGSAGARGDPGHQGAIGDPGPAGHDGADGADVSGSCIKCNSQW